jgi:outer membrane protein
VRGQLLPQISATGDLNHAVSAATSSGATTSATTSTATAMATMTMPLYEGGAIYSQTRQAQQTVGQRRSQRDDARRAAVQTADQNWAALEAACAGIASFIAAMRAAQIPAEAHFRRHDHSRSHCQHWADRRRDFCTLRR